MWNRVVKFLRIMNDSKPRDDGTDGPARDIVLWFTVGLCHWGCVLPALKIRKK
jgi:hypothetical protein